MSIAVALLLVLAGVFGSAVVAGGCWSAHRFFTTLASLDGSVSRSASAAQALAASCAEARESSDRLLKVLVSHQNSVAENTDRAAVMSEQVIDALRSQTRAMQELSARATESVEMRPVLASIDNSIRALLTVIVQNQVPGGIASDAVEGTPLDTSGKVYAYDEDEMAANEALRRKASGRAEQEENAPQV